MIDHAPDWEDVGSLVTADDWAADKGFQKWHHIYIKINVVTVFSTAHMVVVKMSAGCL